MSSAPVVQVASEATAFCDGKTRITLLIGPKGSGKKTLAAMWRESQVHGQTTIFVDPVFRSNDPLIEMVNRSNCLVEHMSPGRLVISATEKPTTWSDEDGIIPAAAIIDRIDQVYAFNKPQHYSRFESFAEYERYTGDPTKYRPAAVEVVPDYKPCVPGVMYISSRIEQAV